MVVKININDNNSFCNIYIQCRYANVLIKTFPQIFMIYKKIHKMKNYGTEPFDHCIDKANSSKKVYYFVN